ncbi:MAG: Uncharacterised protein [Owenweeksia sp. TMED14]|nr:MAG: Uncharacterised protein [Owenweeksia sp. TMED14]
MIGNDIVDLKRAQIDSNWKHPGFQQKLFGEDERRLIGNASDPFQLIWRLWSMKESAYKLFIQEGGACFFNPSKLACQLFDLQNGSVQLDKQEYHTYSTSNTEYIFSSAQVKCRQLLEHSCILPLDQYAYQAQSNLTKKRLLQYVANNNKIRVANLSIRKTDSGVPQIFFYNKKLPASISLTHHGNYGAFSILN